MTVATLSHSQDKAKPERLHFEANGTTKPMTAALAAYHIAAADRDAYDRDVFTPGLTERNLVRDRFPDRLTDEQRANPDLLAADAIFDEMEATFNARVTIAFAMATAVVDAPAKSLADVLAKLEVGTSERLFEEEFRAGEPTPLTMLRDEVRALVTAEGCAGKRAPSY